MSMLSEATDGISKEEAFAGIRNGLATLPVELKEKVLDEVDEFPIVWEDAKMIREELMEERKAFVLKQADEYVATDVISLCEH